MLLNTPRALALLAFVATTGAATAQTIFVNTSDDIVDFGGAQKVANLPGPDGKISLAEAGLASDNTPGVQTIGFRIPQSEWLFQQFFPGRAVLKPFLGFRVFDTAILDARTQTAFTGDTYPAGGEVVIWESTYLIDNVGGAVFGFDNSTIHISGGSANRVQGNTVTGIEVFDSSANLIGGSNPGQGNTGGFIQIDRASDNVVIGNTVDRVRVLGWIGGGQPATNNRIGGPTLGERNFIVGNGTWNSEGAPGGFAVQLFDSVGTLVENNWIGTTPDGLSTGHLATVSGIWFDGENHDTIVRNNRVAGIVGQGIGPHYAGVKFGTAIRVYGSGSGVTIVGNSIGLDANDQPLLGSNTGISVENFFQGPIASVVIGGTAPGDGNEIAGHLAAGINVANSFSDVRIAGNSIHDNAGIGIDLITPAFVHGVTPNDPLDVDTGANGLQNFPEVLVASAGPAGLRVQGRLKSSPSSNFTIEFFQSEQCDPSGFGEGEEFLGRTSLSTDAAGDANFDVTLPVNALPGHFVTATATLEPIGATSEFSACTVITGVVCQPDLGFGGPGTAIMSVCGDALATGGLADFAITGTPPLTTIWLGVSTVANPTPFLGGTVVPFPAQYLFVYNADLAGELHLPVIGGTPVPFDFYVQAAYLDMSLANVIGFTNAVKVQYLP